MLFRPKDMQSTVMRPRITPDPQAAAQLERRMRDRKSVV